MTNPRPKKSILNRLAASPWPAPLLITLASLAILGARLPSEPHFIDESAYYSQSYFFSLFLNGDRHSALWLEYPAADLRPIPKYMIALAIQSAGYPLTHRDDAWAWYGETSTRFEPPGALTAARIPFVVVGALGCLAIYGLGALASGKSIGAIAALLLAVNPLYRLHSRRAMSDVPCEAFMLLALFFILYAWKRILEARLNPATWLLAISAGLAAALSVLSKLSGLLTLLTMTAWAILALVVPVPFTRKFALIPATLLAAAAFALACLALDPFLTAHSTRTLSSPQSKLNNKSFLERLKLLKDQRLIVSMGQQNVFKHNAVTTPLAKIAVVAIQGFGRFGPLGPPHSDSTRRFDPAQDWGLLLWTPLVAAGALLTWRNGRSQLTQNLPPASWAILLHFTIALVVVTAYIPMAWDRYLLPIQAPASLLAASAIVALGTRLLAPSTTHESTP